MSQWRQYSPLMPLFTISCYAPPNYLLLGPLSLLIYYSALTKPTLQFNK